VKSILKKQDPALYKAVKEETQRQAWTLELIASENMVSEAVLEAQGSVLTNKYAEGYPGRRYYGGCEFVDVAENLAIERAKKLFGAEHVNVQPHSGTSANLAVYLSVMNIGDTLMGLNLAHGGHLSHGHPLNFSGKYSKSSASTSARTPSGWTATKRNVWRWNINPKSSAWARRPTRGSSIGRVSARSATKSARSTWPTSHTTPV